MNTLKPLLMVAVLGGIGYGVYVRLNRGNSAPPPPVAEGWDTTPNVRLPDEPSAAPWGPPTAQPAAAGAMGSAPHAALPPPSGGGEAPPYDLSSAAAPLAQALPGQAPPPGQALPFGPSAGASPPPNAANQPAGSPLPQANPSPLPAENPNEYAPNGPGTAPAVPGAQEGPPVDPYGGSYEANVPDRYRTPSEVAPPSDSVAPAGNPAAPDQTPPGGNEPLSAGGSSEFAAAFESARRALEGGQMAEALRQLSKWYDHPELSPAEQQQLNELLDQVAGTVLYSTQNLLEPPYEVQPGERLEGIGEKYGVPWQLLAKINGIDDPSALRPGERLKVVRGPFQAIVSLEKRELTLFAADGSYAGRFKIGIGGENPPREGTFPVAEKIVNPVYRGRHRAISAEDADNPLGERWIGLGGGVGIHGTNKPENIGRTDLPGSISLNERDVEDVYDILSLGSRVTIRR